MNRDTDIARNKELIRAAARHISDRNLPALFDLIHDEGSWSVPYRGDRFPFGGFRDKQALRAMLEGFLGLFEQFEFRLTTMTAEDDRVTVEAVSQGVTANGARYENNYIVIFFIQDGKIHAAREYFDPFQVLAFVEQLPRT